MTFSIGSAAALGGCHTIEGAGKGALLSLYVLAEAGGPPSCGNGGAEILLVALAAGPVIGAVGGAIEDCKELRACIENGCGDGWLWDSPEGQRRRMGAPSLARN